MSLSISNSFEYEGDIEGGLEFFDLRQRIGFWVLGFEHEHEDEHEHEGENWV